MTRDDLTYSDILVILGRSQVKSVTQLMDEKIGYIKDEQPVLLNDEQNMMVDEFVADVNKGIECKSRIEYYEKNEYWDKWEVKVNELWSLYPFKESSAAYRFYLGRNKTSLGRDVVVGTIEDWKQVKRIINLQFIEDYFHQWFVAEGNKLVRSIIDRGATTINLGELGSVSIGELNGRMVGRIVEFSDEIDEEYFTDKIDKFGIDKFIGQVWATVYLNNFDDINYEGGQEDVIFI